MIKKIALIYLVSMSMIVASDTLSYFDEAELTDTPLICTGNVVNWGIYFEIDFTYGCSSLNSIEMQFPTAVSNIVADEWPLTFPMVVYKTLSDSAPGLFALDTLTVLVYDSTELLYPNWTKIDLSNNPKLNNVPNQFWITSPSLSLMVWDSLDPSGHSRIKTVGPERWSTNWDQAIRITYSGMVSTKQDQLFPRSFRILGSYPNPFNPSTTIEYELPEHSTVTLNIYDIQGRLITTLVEQIKPKGFYTTQWNGTDKSGDQVSAGMYFASLQAGQHSSVVKMVYLR